MAHKLKLPNNCTCSQLMRDQKYVSSDMVEYGSYCYPYEFAWDGRGINMKCSFVQSQGCIDSPFPFTSFVD